MKKCIFAVLACWIILIAIGGGEKIYGNDKEGIEKVLLKSDSVEGHIEIIDIIDLGKNRIVGFIEDGENLGVAKFYMNTWGNYELKTMELHDSTQRVSVFKKIHKVEGIYGIEVVIINTEHIGEVELIINEKSKLIKQVEKYPAMLILPIEKTDEVLSVDVKYYM